MDWDSKRLIAALFAVAVSATGADAADQRSCTVEWVEGTSGRYWHEGAWAAITTGHRIAVETKIATGPDARVKIVCDDDIVVTIGIETELNLEQLAGAAGPRRSIVLQLIDGITGIVAPRRSWRRFEVRTAVAIASVRSTDWLVEADPADGSAVFVRTGTVDVRTGAQTYRLQAGDGITIGADGAPGPVKVWGAPRIARSVGALGFDWE